MRHITHHLLPLVGLCALAACTSDVSQLPTTPLLSSSDLATASVQFALLPSLGGRENAAVAVNASGQIVGHAILASGAPGAHHAVLWDGGVLTDLGPGIANDIDDNGRIVGMNGARAFVWQNGVMTTLPSLYGGTSEALSINASGDIVGQCANPSTLGALRPCLWSHGTVVDLGSLGLLQSTAQAINASGVIVGGAGLREVRAVVWEAGVARTLPFLPKEGDSYAFDLNDRGDIVGRTFVGHRDTHAALWNAGGVTDLGTLGGRFSGAEAINELGEIVGISTTHVGNYRAFLWSGGVMLPLPAKGGEESYALDINLAGEVVGSVRKLDGTWQAARWTIR